MKYRCLIRCLVQKNDPDGRVDQFGTPLCVINLSAKPADPLWPGTYTSSYDLCQFNPPGEQPLFERMDGPVGSDPFAVLKNSIEPKAAAPKSHQIGADGPLRQELLQIAKEMGISGVKTMNKAELTEAIEIQKELLAEEVALT